MKDDKIEEHQSRTETSSESGTMTADDVASHLEGSQQEISPETLDQLGIGKGSGQPQTENKGGGKKGSIFTSAELEFE